MLKKSQISRILIDGDRKLLQRLCKEIEQSYTVNIIKPPEKGLVMTKAKDSVSQQPFYMGEVLVTECTVSVNGTYGFGILMGEDAASSYQLAVADGAFQARLPETETWEALLLAEEQRIEAEHKLAFARSMKTKVNFDTMEEYNAKR